MDGRGVLRRGRGYTRHSSKGMFIYSDSEPPPKADFDERFVSVGRPNLHESPNEEQNSFGYSVWSAFEPGADTVRILNRSTNTRRQVFLEDREEGLGIEPLNPGAYLLGGGARQTAQPYRG